MDYCFHIQVAFAYYWFLQTELLLHFSKAEQLHCHILQMNVETGFLTFWFACFRTYSNGGVCSCEGEAIFDTNLTLVIQFLNKNELEAHGEAQSTFHEYKVHHLLSLQFQVLCPEY